MQVVRSCTATGAYASIVNHDLSKQRCATAQCVYPRNCHCCKKVTVNLMLGESTTVVSNEHEGIVLVEYGGRLIVDLATDE
jgi:hypothetical protein